MLFLCLYQKEKRVKVVKASLKLFISRLQFSGIIVGSVLLVSLIFPHVVTCWAVMASSRALMT